MTCQLKKPPKKTGPQQSPKDACNDPQADKDPPFYRLHLLCCRNLLIYLNTQAQKRLLPLFHYTLIPEGVLILGASETIGGIANLFDVLGKKWKIFKRLEVP
jgi:two-component system CheB/CheR fusion protein